MYKAGGHPGEKAGQAPGRPLLPPAGPWVAVCTRPAPRTRGRRPEPVCCSVRSQVCDFQAPTGRSFNAAACHLPSGAMGAGVHGLVRGRPLVHARRTGREGARSTKRQTGFRERSPAAGGRASAQPRFLPRAQRAYSTKLRWLLIAELLRPLAAPTASGPQATPPPVLRGPLPCPGPFPPDTPPSVKTEIKVQRATTAGLLQKAELGRATPHRPLCRGKPATLENRALSPGTNRLLCGS